MLYYLLSLFVSVTLVISPPSGDTNQDEMEIISSDYMPEKQQIIGNLFSETPLTEEAFYVFLGSLILNLKIYKGRRKPIIIS